MSAAAHPISERKMASSETGAGNAPKQAAQQRRAKRQKRFLDFLRARPSKEWLLKFGLSGKLAPLSFARRRETQIEESSSAEGLPRSRNLRVPFVRKIDWKALFDYGKRWIKSPLNAALLVWLVACAVVFLLMVFISIGLLNGVIQENTRRKNWVEGCNQILNALFTLMCVYQYPKLFYQLVLVFRWTAEGAAELRLAYSKKGLVRPHERLHIAFVVVLLHLTCFAQFALCALFWAFNRSSRPGDLVTVFLALGIVSPVIAALYTLWGPLGRKIENDTDEESQIQKPEEGEKQKRVLVQRPEWVGGLFDCWDDITVAYLSFFCTFCVFGWNMERLGFGNMYVHIFTFVFLIATPIWVFTITGLQIDDHGVREGVAIVGVLLCFLGLLYGGFWRIQMRKKFKLPPNYFFWGYPNFADCMQWLLCWSCALSQEVRTGNFYDIEEGSFYSKNSSSSEEEIEEEENDGGKELPELKPLPREDMTNVMAPPMTPTIGQPGSETKVDELQNHGV